MSVCGGEEGGGTVLSPERKSDSLGALNHFYRNFGENCPSNGIGIELYHLQNTSKSFAFSPEKAWLL